MSVYADASQAEHAAFCLPAASETTAHVTHVLCVLGETPTPTGNNTDDALVSFVRHLISTTSRQRRRRWLDQTAAPRPQQRQLGTCCGRSTSTVNHSSSDINHLHSNDAIL